MTSVAAPVRGASRSAFTRLLRNEVRLAWRQPIGLVFGLGLPLVLLVVFGAIPAFHTDQANLGGLSYFDLYLPILVALVIAALGLASLPGALASYREQGILRRSSTTPVPPSWLLAAQLVINVALAAVAMAVLLILGTTVLGASAPSNVVGLLVAIVLSTAAMFAIGLWISAVAPGTTAAGIIGMALFFPLLFFAGLWVPRPLMPAILREISDWTPLGAAVRAIQAAMSTGFPPWSALLVLAGWAAVFTALAVRWFRWE